MYDLVVAVAKLFYFLFYFLSLDHAQKSLVDRHKAVQKLTQQQRYSSEDLYKPRPILGQRSRRRGMDTLI